MRERVRAARGYGGPREWVLTAALPVPREAQARAVARSKVASATTYNTRIPPHAYQSAQLLLEWRTVQLLYCGDNSRVWETVRAARGYGGPREWVLTAALAEAARGPATRRLWSWCWA